jgi:hypothetical protein
MGIRYVPEFEKRWSRFARPVGRSWRMDETYISVRGLISRSSLDTPEPLVDTCGEHSRASLPERER